MGTTRIRCYSCDRKLDENSRIYCVNVALEDQDVYVGSECFRKIKKAGAAGYQPPKGGPKLFLLCFHKPRP
jgi:hypothetical protein